VRPVRPRVTRSTEGSARRLTGHLDKCLERYALVWAATRLSRTCCRRQGPEWSCALRNTRISPSPGQSFPKVNASYLNLLVLAAEMQQVHDSCNDHGSGGQIGYRAGGAQLAVGGPQHRVPAPRPSTASQHRVPAPRPSTASQHRVPAPRPPFRTPPAASGYLMVWPPLISASSSPGWTVATTPA
jgi:hypothetical protein